MTILNSDLKIRASQVLDDIDTGGGRMSAQEIVSGDVNNLFEDISRLDRTYGRVSLRKVFMSVESDNVDKLLGSHMVVSKLPQDPNVNVTLFYNDKPADVRSEVKSDIEAYVVSSIQESIYLLGLQSAGQITISVWKSITNNPPSIGDVLRITGGGNSEYVKVVGMEITRTELTYTENNTLKTKTVDVIALELSASLANSYDGGGFDPTTYQNGTVVYRTQVAEAAKYYGATLLEQSANVGDLSLKLPSIFSQLVPSATTETILADAIALSAIEPNLPTSEGMTYTFEDLDFDQDIYMNQNFTVTVYTPTPIVPGTLSIPGLNLNDGGDGEFTTASYIVKSIDYAAGKMSLRPTSGRSFYYYIEITYTPATPSPQAPYTHKIEVTSANQGLSYTLTMNPIPAVGAFRVEFRSLGKWFYADDDGTGALVGDANGSINFNTGTVSVTLDALPDVDSTILFSWGTFSDYKLPLTPPATFDAGMGAGGDHTYLFYRREVTLPAGKAYSPGTLTISFNDGSARTVTADANDVLTGRFDGRVIPTHSGFIVQGSFDSTPNKNAAITLDYSYSDRVQQTFTKSLDVNDKVTISLAQTNITPGSVTISYDVRNYAARKMVRAHVKYAKQNFSKRLRREIHFHTEYRTTRTFADDGAGGFGPELPATIDYVAGTIEFEPNAYQETFKIFLGSWVDSTENDIFDNNTDVTVTCEAVNVTDNVVGDSENLTELRVGLNVSGLEPVIPNTTVVRALNRLHVDREGAVYSTLDPQTNAGTATGYMDYDKDELVITSWSTSGSPSRTVNCEACLAAYGDYEKTEYTFRTAGSPLRDSSFQIRATAANENEDTLSADTDVNGDFINEVGGDFTGLVKAQHGLVDVTFPEAVYPSSVRYNAVIQNTLPLNAELIGIDPVRLPSDGRVPIFKKGYVCVITHTATTNAGTPTDAQVINVGRTNQAEFFVEDASGNAVNPAQYTTDSATGTVTLANPFTFEDASNNALSGDLIVRDRVEDMALINDVNLDGTISVVRPLTQNYPANETVVSSAVLFGDLSARLSMWEERTTDQGWTDNPGGSDPNSSYDFVNNPFQINNNGSMTERWKIKFTSGTAFELIGETVGVIATGNTSTNFAPVNPATGSAYFQLDAAGWGSGWQSGYTIHFNTIGAQEPLWVIRTVLAGQATNTDDKFELQRRGDAD